MAILDADPQETPQERLTALEAEVLVLRQHVRLLFSLFPLERAIENAKVATVRDINVSAQSLS